MAQLFNKFFSATTHLVFFCHMATPPGIQHDRSDSSQSCKASAWWKSDLAEDLEIAKHIPPVTTGSALPGSSVHCTQHCCKSFPEVVTKKYHGYMCSIFILVRNFQNLFRHFFSFLYFSPIFLRLQSLCIISTALKKNQEKRNSLITVYCNKRILPFTSMKHLN